MKITESDTEQSSGKDATKANEEENDKKMKETKDVAQKRNLATSVLSFSTLGRWQEAAPKSKADLEISAVRYIYMIAILHFTTTEPMYARQKLSYKIPEFQLL